MLNRLGPIRLVDTTYIEVSRGGVDGVTFPGCCEPGGSGTPPNISSGVYGVHPLPGGTPGGVTTPGGDGPGGMDVGGVGVLGVIIGVVPPGVPGVVVFGREAFGVLEVLGGGCGLR